MSGKPSSLSCGSKKVRVRSKLVENLQPRASQAAINSSNHPFVVLLTPGATRAWTEGHDTPPTPHLVGKLLLKFNPCKSSLARRYV